MNSVNQTYFPTPIQEFVFWDKYSRWSPELGRREYWPETVDRVVDFLRELADGKIPENDMKKIHEAILHMDISPSMRLFSTAGAEARRNHMALYNCCYLPITDIRAFAELLQVSMSGVGAGYSVERQYTDMLPEINTQRLGLSPHDVYVIEDSAMGWVKAFLFGLQMWFKGLDVEFDYSLIRPAGAILKTKGGRASGSGVLKTLMHTTRDTVLDRQGKKLRPIDVFDICTQVGACAVSGGSRRSAQLCMFDFNDQEMRAAKHGMYWETHPNRANANISVVLEHHMDRLGMVDLFEQMFAGFTGEPGIVSRVAMDYTRPMRRREMTHGGVNACAEINLRGDTEDGRFGGQFCNLSSVQVRPEDTIQSLKRKVRLATIIGTIQATATDFAVLRPEWKEICEEERLLGVSLIGHMDNEMVRKANNQFELQQVAVDTNRVYAKRLGINQAAGVTCVKPSGNSSVLYGVARGINARYAPYYIRRVRVNAHSPMYRVLRDSGVPISPENDQEEPNVNTYVATFYEKSPEGALTIEDHPAISQLEYWKTVKQFWCEHNPSVTIEYHELEKGAIAAWAFLNQTLLNGLAFLPRTDHIYRQAPYEKIAEEEYDAATAAYPSIDFELLQEYEKQDRTERWIECSAGVCDLV